MQDHRAPTKANPSGRPAHVLFFAVVPPPEIKAQMAKAWQSFGTGETFRHDTLHLSISAVAGVDDLDPVFVERVRQAATALRTAPFTLCFDRLMTFTGRSASRPLVMATNNASDKPNEIATDLHAAFRAMNLASSRSRKVTPHVTLAYGPGFSDTRHLSNPILWTITEITLIDSLQGQGRHIPLGQWSLPQDRQQPSFDF